MSEPWNLPDRELTPEPASKSRRRFLIGLGIGGAALAGAGAGLWWWNAGSDDDVLAAGRVELPHESDYFPAKLKRI